MKLSEIQDLIKFVAKSGVSEVELETKDVKIVIKTPASTKGNKGEYLTTVMPNIPATTVIPQVIQAAPVPQVPVVAAETKVADIPKGVTTEESKYITVKSPMIGTFYRSPSPDKPAFVNVGEDVVPGKAICIIEAMKLFNEIESDVTGKIVKVLVDDASPVEYDQPLFLVDPS